MSINFKEYLGITIDIINALEGSLNEIDRSAVYKSVDDIIQILFTNDEVIWIESNINNKECE